MRATTIAIALLLGLASASAAQEWIEYQNNEDGFKVDFPGQPKISDTTWVTEQAYVLPARVYSAEMGGGKYSMTVVDYSVIERLGMERSAKCPIGAETCQGQPAGGLRIAIGPGYATQEIRDGLVFASFKYIQREGAKVTEYVWNWEDLVEGHELHLTNADGSRTFGEIHMHENRLYIFEATVPKGAPSPELFQQSVGFIDSNGVRVRYNGLYSNAYPAPTRVQY
jgi:hypothetical protein